MEQGKHTTVPGGRMRQRKVETVYIHNETGEVKLSWKHMKLLK